MFIKKTILCAFSLAMAAMLVGCETTKRDDFQKADGFSEVENARYMIDGRTKLCFLTHRKKHAFAYVPCAPQVLARTDAKDFAEEEKSTYYVDSLTGFCFLDSDRAHAFTRVPCTNKVLDLVPPAQRPFAQKPDAPVLEAPAAPVTPETLPQGGKIIVVPAQ